MVTRPPALRPRGLDALWDVFVYGGLTERQLARESGLSYATVNHLLHGRRGQVSPSTAGKLAAALGHPVELLFEPVPR